VYEKETAAARWTAVVESGLELGQGMLSECGETYGSKAAGALGSQTQTPSTDRAEKDGTLHYDRIHFPKNAMPDQRLDA